MGETDRMRSRARAILALLIAVPLRGGPSLAQETDERVLTLSILDNKSFADPWPEDPDERGVLRIPWWRSARGTAQLEIDDEGRTWLATPPGESASQPIPCFRLLVDRLTIAGVVRGTGRLIVRDGNGARASFELGGGEEPVRFHLDGSEILARAGGALVPRLELELASSSAEPARWRSLEASTALPCPEPAALRAEIVAELERVFDEWLARDLDEQGPLATGFLAWQHDVVTGERITRLRVTCHPLFLLLGRALACEEKPAWRAAWERFLASYFEHGLHETTGIPRNWDCERDQPDDERALEISQALAFLIDLATEGEAGWRERAREAARAVGETVLARGCLPDGSVAARYRPSDGAPNTDTPPLRARDMPAQLGRLGALLDDARFLAAARAAVRRFEFTHYWAGKWEYLDPGFDDHYGHFGDRALTLWRADPRTPSFRRIALGGMEFYAPLWRDAVRLGGYVAADEVRCWPIATGIAALEPGSGEWIAPVLAAAVRAHFKSEQFPDGSWGDVTYYDYDPKASLEVGDLPAIPQNLLLGLAIAYAADLGPPREELRAMFTAVMRQTAATFRRPHGYLSTRAERPGQNLAGGSIRLATGLVEMLEALER